MSQPAILRRLESVHDHVKVNIHQEHIHHDAAAEVRIAALCAIATASLVTDASAQTPTVPIAEGKPCSLPKLDGPDPSKPGTITKMKPTAALTGVFQSGNWTLLKTDVAEIRKLFQSGGRCSADLTHALIPADYLVVSWVGDTPFGETALLSAVVHEDDRDDGLEAARALRWRDAQAVPDLRQRRTGRCIGVGVYVNARRELPLLKQIPDVADKILNPLLGLLSANMGIKPQGPGAGPRASLMAGRPCRAWICRTRAQQ